MYNIKYKLKQKIKYKKAIFECNNGELCYIKDIIKEGYIFAIEISNEYESDIINIRYKVQKGIKEISGWVYVNENNIVN